MSILMTLWREGAQKNADVRRVANPHGSGHVAGAYSGATVMRPFMLGWKRQK